MLISVISILIMLIMLIVAKYFSLNKENALKNVIYVKEEDLNKFDLSGIEETKDDFFIL